MCIHLLQLKAQLNKWLGRSDTTSFEQLAQAFTSIVPLGGHGLETDARYS